ncbi:MAG: hypothetical protein R6X13_03260 [bacterium]
MEGRRTVADAAITRLCLALALWLGASSSLSAQPLFEGSEADANPWRLRVEGASMGSSLYHRPADHDWLGFSSAYWNAFDILGVQAEKGRWRVGTCLYSKLTIIDYYDSYLPVNVEFVVWERPLWYKWRLHGMMPELAFRLRGYWLNPMTGNEHRRLPIVGRLEAVAGADLLGVGLSLSAGVIGAVSRAELTAGEWTTFVGLSPNVEVRLRALTFGADLDGR